MNELTILLIIVFSFGVVLGGIAGACVLAAVYDMNTRRQKENTAKFDKLHK